MSQQVKTFHVPTNTSGASANAIYEVLKKLAKQHDMSVNEVGRRVMCNGLRSGGIDFDLRIQTLEKETAKLYENFSPDVSSDSEVS
jgi:hypothetical protein